MRQATHYVIMFGREDFDKDSEYDDHRGFYKEDKGFVDILDNRFYSMDELKKYNSLIVDEKTHESFQLCSDTKTK